MLLEGHGVVSEPVATVCPESTRPCESRTFKYPLAREPPVQGLLLRTTFHGSRAVWVSFC